jgi:phospholipid/cholesterol/gamma-HCH transport system substrate-binding protein
VTARFAALLGPTADDLRPFARNLEPLNASLRGLADATTPVLEDEIRPFVRAARPVVGDLRTAADRFNAATPPLTELARRLNRFGNIVSYNPNGAEPLGASDRDEGYLYWTAWAAHVGNSIFSGADANGAYWRVYLSQDCESALDLVSSPIPAIGALKQLLTGLTDPILQQLGCN